MTINRTTLLDLPLPVTGTESGVWGDVTNNGLTQYVDIAIAGRNALTSANFTAGALTLSLTEGDSSATNIAAGSAQYATLYVSSLAANSTITAPSSNRAYRVVNADATYTLTIKASGQTGVTLQPGQSATVVFNGTDYVFVGVVLGTAQTFTAAQTFRAASAVRSEAASTQDAVVLAGRAGGTSSYAVTLTPATLASSTTLTLPNVTDTVATIGTGQTFTGANTFRNASGTRFEEAATQDAVIIDGRAGGTSSYAVTFTPTTLSANRTLTLPDATGTILQSGTAVTVAQGGTGLTAGTSGGIPYYSSTSAITSSGVLSANQFVFGGGAGSSPTSSATVSFAVSFTGANTFYNSTGQTFGTGTSTQDGFVIGGRAGGSSSYRITFTPDTLSASRTVTFPDGGGNYTVGYRNLPAVGTKTGSYTLATADVGKYVQVGSGGSITIPNATFAEGDIISLFNNTTGDITITCSITDAYIAGTDSDKATMTLATRGVATILFISSTRCVVSGNVT